MGATQSKEMEKDLSLLSDEDRQAIAVLFGTDKLDHLSTVPRSKIFEQLIESCSKENELFVERFCDILSEYTTGETHVTLRNYIKYAVRLLKGPTEGKASVVIYLASGQSKFATSKDIMNYLKTIVSLFKLFSSLEPSFKSWDNYMADEDSMIENLCQYLGRDLFFHEIPSKERSTLREIPDKNFKELEVSEWLIHNHVLAEIHTMLFTRFFNMSTPNVVAPLIPLCMVQANSGYKKFLSFSEIIFVNTAIPLEVRDTWRLLYSTSAHGESFSTLFGNILEKGPSLVFVEDTHGHRFGGFAAEDWRVNPHFYGKPTAFLFSIKPLMATFGCTGYNEHYQYFNIKCHTFPNGLGFGGQLEYFCLWIDSDFGKGYCSPSSSTYGNPQLSHEKEFKIQHLEIWGVGVEPKKEVTEKVSILDVDMEAAAMLKVTGKTPVSEGLRDTATSDQPGEKELPPLDTALYGSSPPGRSRFNH
ncbi:MTOR-associated protein MEAK7-like [Artemia franciscana]|uniref:MTOR-associated protein MEAK7 n=1 Tax=Artemia franciscana TaxID=6661 RepID=A0AA88HI45_ARTSF|nr:hypothetical protein QYM36_013344 [Artemia franciscana]